MTMIVLREMMVMLMLLMMTMHMVIKVMALQRTRLTMSIAVTTCHDQETRGDSPNPSFSDSTCGVSAKLQNVLKLLTSSFSPCTFWVFRPGFEPQVRQIVKQTDMGRRGALGRASGGKWLRILEGLRDLAFQGRSEFLAEVCFRASGSAEAATCRVTVLELSGCEVDEWFRSASRR